MDRHKLNISVCMIVRNEEKILSSAIASTKGLADEVVVLDTGSTDGTLELAKKLGCRVLTGADRFNKGESRNRAIDEAKGEWIVVLDADEQIADPIGLRAFLETTNALAVYIRLSYMDGDQPTLAYSQMRCWSKGTYKYKYRAHEVPFPVNGWTKTAKSDFVWEHRPPKDRDWKLDYSLKRLLLDVKENPGEARPLYYLGRQHMYRKEWKKSVRILKKYLALQSGYDRADAYYCLSQCYGQLDNKKAQIEALYQACSEDPTRREWWGGLASIYHSRGQNQIAVGVLKCALEISLPENTYANYYWYGSHIYDLLARCLWKLKRYEEGSEFARKALDLSPDSVRLRRNLACFDSMLGDMDAFYQAYGANVHSGYPRHQAIAELVEGPKLLDVGCGSGDLLLILQNMYPQWELEGIDISKVALDMARNRGVIANLHYGDSVPDGYWNTIVMSQVLEHLEDDSALVNSVREKCDTLVVSVPKGNMVPSPDHKREYTEQSIYELMSMLGTPLLHHWSGGKNRILMSVRVSK